MEQTIAFSRRAAFPTLAALPLLGIVMPKAQVLSTDAHLLALGRDFDVAVAKLDHAIADGGNLRFW